MIFRTFSAPHLNVLATQGRRASRLPLAVIFRAFGAAQESPLSRAIIFRAFGAVLAWLPLRTAFANRHRGVGTPENVRADPLRSRFQY